MKYLIFFLCLAFLPGAALAAEGKKAYGLYERIILPQLGGVSVEAKLDTGAETSSLGADDIETFERDGEDWVRFTPQIPGAGPVELPVARHSRIKRRADGSGNTESIRRPVVLLEVCFDGAEHKIEVNLADRSRFKYPLLIGSGSLVRFRALVDPSLTYQAKVSCP